jgi:hypothetical protein
MFESGFPERPRARRGVFSHAKCLGGGGLAGRPGGREEGGGREGGREKEREGGRASTAALGVAEGRKKKMTQHGNSDVNWRRFLARALSIKCTNIAN